MRDQTEGLAGSVHARLIQHAKKRSFDPNLVLTRYGVERFLYRLSMSPHSERFVLKGALLLLAWLGETVRPTRDADLLGLGDLSDAALISIFSEICSYPVKDDGVDFDPDSVQVSDIREEDPYGGKRVNLTGHLGSGRLRIQVDVGIGDAVEPAPEWIEYPVLLDLPPPKLLAYRPETVVSEKLQAMVHLGTANSRMKDFYDLHLLAETHVFYRDQLARAVGATFNRRATPIPETAPTPFSPEFVNESKKKQWAAFLGKNGIHGAPDLGEVTAHLAEFLMPVLEQVRHASGTPRIWERGGPWVDSPR
jgi:hypothetical protein